MPFHRRTALAAHATQPDTRQQKPQAKAVEYGVSTPVVTP